MTGPILGINISVTEIRPFYGSVSGKIGELGSGTGFFFRKDDKLYVITNRHVIISEEEHTYPEFIKLKIHNDNNNLQSTREISIDLYNGSKPQWLEHPKGGSMDIVALDITSFIESTDIIFAFQKEFFPNKDIVIDPSSVVAVCGYPLGFYDRRNNLPIIRRGSIASSYWQEFNGEQKFLLDSILHEGMSGSPVVLLPTGMERSWNGSLRMGVISPPYLLGIHTGSITPLGGPDVQLYYEYYFWVIADLLGIPRQI